MKRFLWMIVLFCMFCFGGAVSANVVAETDNNTQSVIYRVYDKIGMWNINRYEFVKNITDNGDVKYFFVVVTNFIPQKDVHLVAGSKYLLHREIEFCIDGKILVGNKMVQDVRYPQVINEGNRREWIYYQLPDNVITSLEKANKVQFAVRAIKGKTYNIAMKDDVLLDIKKVIADGTFDRYLEM